MSQPDTQRFSSLCENTGANQRFQAVRYYAVVQAKQYIGQSGPSCSIFNHFRVDRKTAIEALNKIGRVEIAKRYMPVERCDRIRNFLYPLSVQKAT